MARRGLIEAKSDSKESPRRKPLSAPGSLSLSDFARLADAHRISGETREALRLVMVDGMSAYAAAQQTGVQQSTISRARRKIERPLCPHCGHVI